MKALVILCGVVIAVVFATMSTSRGDGEQVTDPSATGASDNSEPITGTAVMPFAGATPETPTTDPTTPYTGGPAAEWKYEDLTAAERAIADRGLAEDQSKIQDAYAAAARDLAAQAKAETAAQQLGAEDLDQVGVIGDGGETP